MSNYRELAAQRTRQHDGRRTTEQVAVYDNADLVGVIAEGEFAKKYGFPLKDVRSDKRDPGWDFILDGRKIDIKATARPDGNLLVPTAAKRPIVADIYVLAIVNVGNETAEFVGWMDQKSVRLCPIRKVTNNSYPVYFVERSKLFPMEEL